MCSSDFLQYNNVNAVISHSQEQKKYQKKEHESSGQYHPLRIVSTVYTRGRIDLYNQRICNYDKKIQGKASDIVIANEDGMDKL
jgi:hypothetical protein